MAVACQFCQKSFEPNNMGQKYCGRSCAAKVLRTRRPKVLKPIACFNTDCGKPFQPPKKTSRYCSFSCAMAAAAAKRPPKIVKERPLSADYISRKAVVRDAYALLKEIPPDTRTPGQIICAEPLPGRSALDQKMRTQT